MYQTGGTIKDILEDIRQRKFVLPAIQREFVWQPEQIARLFDSLMQGYPFGTFLYWKVDKSNSGLVSPETSLSSASLAMPAGSPGQTT